MLINGHPFDDLSHPQVLKVVLEEWSIVLAKPRQACLQPRNPLWLPHAGAVEAQVVSAVTVQVRVKIVYSEQVLEQMGGPPHLPDQVIELHFRQAQVRSQWDA